MTRRYALKGAVSGQALTYAGRILTHGDRAELEFLFPGSAVFELGPGTPQRDTFPLRDHPDMAPVSFPLCREDFV